MQAVVHLAFSGQDGSVKSEELLKDGHTEGVPQKIALAPGKRRVLNGAQDHNRGGETGQVEPGQTLPVGQSKGEIERRDERVRSVGSKPFQIVSAEPAHIVAGTKVSFD